MKDKLIQYQGGGYDGCIWEWNFCFFDVDGNFEDIYSTGSMGCKTAEDLERYMADSYNKEDTEYYIIDVWDDKQLEEFSKTENPSLVLGIAKWLSEEQGFSVPAKCDRCGTKVKDASSFIPEGFEGDGGIGVRATELICEDCNTAHTCGWCGEFCDDNKGFDEDGNCEYCQVTIEENAEKSKLKDKWVKWHDFLALYHNLNLEEVRHEKSRTRKCLF